MRLFLMGLIGAIALMAVFIKQAEASTCRSSSVVRQFKKLNPCPDYLVVNGKCTGITDHVCSLFSGGFDSTANMQWQSHKASKAKDRIENTLIGKLIWCNHSNSTPKRQVFNCR